MRGGGEEDDKREAIGGNFDVGGWGEGGVSDLTFVLFRLCFHGNATEIMFNR